jgi:hypothetical protein
MKKLFNVKQVIEYVVYTSDVQEAKEILVNQSKVPDEYIPLSMITEIVDNKDIPYDFQNKSPISKDDIKGSCEKLLLKIRESKPKLKFKYCECGCKSSVLKIAGRTFSIHQVLSKESKDKPIRVIEAILYNGHCGDILGRHPTYDDAVLEAERLVKCMLEEIQNELKG